MQGGCKLGLEKQMFSFRRQPEAEKLAKSNHPYQTMKSPEILSCPQDEQKTPSILYLHNFGAKCIILYNYKLLQTEDFLNDTWAYPIAFEHHQYCRAIFKTHQTTCMMYCHLSKELSSVSHLSILWALSPHSHDSILSPTVAPALQLPQHFSYFSLNNDFHASSLTCQLV